MEYVYYSQYGAVGDGITDDFDAIIKAHKYANANGLGVKADKDAVYYIGGADKTAVIKTDTDFGNAEFIIDDTALENITSWVFTVKSMSEPYTPTGLNSVRIGQKNIGISLPCDSVLILKDAGVRRYIRFGPNQNNGSAQTDVIKVSANGDIDETTPLIWDFDNITSITAYPTDSEVLTIKGGIFTTVANRQESRYTYHNRGICITRSNTVVDGLTHYIKDELDHGAPYGGFISINRCTDVTVCNTVLTGHKTYSTIGSAGVKVAMGSYDLSVGEASNVKFINCTQTNDICDRTYWGILGSNYSKNITYDSCVLSRFDAHMGVRNATIRNCKLGHMGINAIGSGTFLVENTTVYSWRFINLRDDYGSTWEGDFIIRSCTFIPNNGGAADAYLIGGHNSGNHNFGYTCHMPERIIFENLTVDDSNHPAEYNGVKIFTDFNPDYNSDSYAEVYPYIKTKEIILESCKTSSGKPFIVSNNKHMFSDVCLTVK